MLKQMRRNPGESVWRQRHQLNRDDRRTDQQQPISRAASPLRRFQQGLTYQPSTGSHDSQNHVHKATNRMPSSHKKRRNENYPQKCEIDDEKQPICRQETRWLLCDVRSISRLKRLY